ncbi:hypothetical protein BJV78DRAFT_120521 [Lactifluus subvellereus]|nr:hypothetical protein BJV78DRAFT_120521 [Lactifluus subvellereus]
MQAHGDGRHPVFSPFHRLVERTIHPITMTTPRPPPLPHITRALLPPREKDRKEGRAGKKVEACTRVMMRGMRDGRSMGRRNGVTMRACDETG